MSEEHTRIEIRWYVVPNANKQKGGFLPVYTLNGKLYGNTWSSYAIEEEEAWLAAEQMATEEAAHYVGDWNITCEKGMANVKGSL